MQKNIFRGVGILVLLIIAFFTIFTWERVDAGHEGIKVDLYGSDKGVNDVSMCTGMVWYNRWTTAVYEYPTYVQTVDYPEFSTNSKEGTKFGLDPMLLVKVKDTKSPQVFRKYRQDMPTLLNGVIGKYVRDACRIQINKYPADYIISHREEIETAIEAYLRQILEKENFELQSFTSGLTYPKSIVDAVDAKTKAIQEAQTVENQIKVAEAQAKKKLIEAEAEAQANKLKTEALTPAILQKMWIDKWDGDLPQTMTGSSASSIMVGVK